jgi:hypothetical protein
MFDAVYSAPGIYIRSPTPESFQLFSGETPWTERYINDNWCLPVLANHHVAPEAISQIYHFERQLYPRLLPNDFIRRIDIFNGFAPNFMLEAYERGDSEVMQAGWTALPEDEKVEPVEGTPFHAEFCREACRSRFFCWQWTFFGDANECWLAHNLLRIGTQRKQADSGWMLHRFRAMRNDKPCENRTFVS